MIFGWILFFILVAYAAVRSICAIWHKIHKPLVVIDESPTETASHTTFNEWVHGVEEAQLPIARRTLGSYQDDLGEEVQLPSARRTLGSYQVDGFDPPHRMLDTFTNMSDDEDLDEVAVWPGSHDPDGFGFDDEDLDEILNLRPSSHDPDDLGYDDEDLEISRVDRECDDELSSLFGYNEMPAPSRYHFGRLYQIAKERSSQYASFMSGIGPGRFMVVDGVCVHFDMVEFAGRDRSVSMITAGAGESALMYKFVGDRLFITILKDELHNSVIRELENGNVPVEWEKLQGHKDVVSQVKPTILEW